jgi:hypothetical protein
LAGKSRAPLIRAAKPNPRVGDTNAELQAFRLVFI